MSNTALGRTEIALLTNKSGGSVAQGDVVIVDTANAAAFTTTTTGAYVSGRIGVVLEPNGIANNAIGLIAFSGYVPVINLSGTGSIGDLVKTHTVAKQGVRHAAPLVAGDFAQVLGTSATPVALLFGSVNPGAFDASAVNITGTFKLSGDISPAQITSNQDDYNPTGLSTATVLRLNTDASRNITSLQGGADGRIIVIVNVGSFNIVLKDDDGSTGTAANRFALSGDITLAADDGVILQYDSTSTRWRCIGKSPGGAGGSVVYPKTADMWHDQSLVTTGNALRHTVNTSQRYNSYTDQNAAANGDVSNNGFFIAAGTYTLKILGVKSTDTGKLDVTIDGGSVLGTLDFYNGSAVFNTIFSIASVVISTDGYHKLTMTVNGKNASSSDYHIYITKMWFEPSAY